MAFVKRAAVTAAFLPSLVAPIRPNATLQAPALMGRSIVEWPRYHARDALVVGLAAAAGVAFPERVAETQVSASGFRAARLQ